MTPKESEMEARRAALRADNLTAPKPSKAAAPSVAAKEKKAGWRVLVWQGKPWEAFKTTATLFSFVTNLILLIVVAVLASWLFDLKNAIAVPLVGGLHTSFVEMDNAHIQTVIEVNDQIQVDDTIPVVFDLPVQTRTVVTTTEPIFISGASVNIRGGILTIDNAPTTILLPANTALPIELNIHVPVSQTVPVLLDVPVHLTVPVDIALNQTDLHQPFARLQATVGPYNALLADVPNTWDEAMCKYARFCFFSQ